MAEDRATADMVRVVVFADTDDRNAQGMRELAQGLVGQVPRASKYEPRLYFLTPEQSVIGYIDYLDDHDGPHPAGTQVLQILEWAAASERVIRRADRYADRGRYTEALNELDAFLEQDRKVSHLIRLALGHTEAEEPTEDTPPSPLFEGLRAEKAAAYEALARRQLEEARALADNEEYPAAIRLLRNIVRGPEEFATTREGEALLEEIRRRTR